MGCGCGKKKGSVNHFSTEQQAKIARERGIGVMTSAGSRQRPAKQSKET